VDNICFLTEIKRGTITVLTCSSREDTVVSGFFSKTGLHCHQSTAHTGISYGKDYASPGRNTQFL
jgi:hypothetical protein